MRRSLVEGHGVLPGLGRSMRVEPFVEEGGHVIEGVLRSDASDRSWHPITRGVPCFLEGPLRPDFGWFEEKYGLSRANHDTARDRSDAGEQALTNVTFSDKWSRFRKYGIEPGHQEFLFGWYCRKLGLSDLEHLRGFYRAKRKILEIGPGSGFNSRFMAQHCGGEVIAVDISDAAYTTFENTKDLPNCHVLQADVMDLPLPEGSFDFVIADGVLHHTPDTRKALRALYRMVMPGGQLFFYVYRKMGAARSYCDEHIRSHYTRLAPEACYEACEGLTELGRELSRLGAKITLEKGVPVLGIPPGTHDVQRLLYYNFVKCFWNESFDFETNNMVNFDWYHPHHAWQHTQDEVAGWLKELDVIEYDFNDANPNGISVLLKKKAG